MAPQLGQTAPDFEADTSTAKTTYPQGWKAPRPYLRIVPQPKG